MTPCSIHVMGLPKTTVGNVPPDSDLRFPATCHCSNFYFVRTYPEIEKEQQCQTFV